MTPEDKEMKNSEGYIWDDERAEGSGEKIGEDGVPLGEGVAYEEDQAETAETMRRCGYSYTVKAGDTIYLIGEKFQVSWREIAEVNGIRPPYAIRPGQVIVIPVVVHRVRRGESLWSIAHLYNIPWQSLADANDIKYPYTIVPGQVLAIPGKRCELGPPIPPHPPAPPVPPPRPRRIPCGILYVVRAGDTVSSLAAFFGITNEEIIRANRLRPPYTIYVDQELFIPVTPRLYRVVAGDTLSVLASRFQTTVEVIARVNGLRPPYTIYEGQYLFIVSPCRRYWEPDETEEYDDTMDYPYGYDEYGNAQPPY